MPAEEKVPGTSSWKMSPKAPDGQRMTVRTIDSHVVQEFTAAGGEQHLADAQHGAAARHLQILGDAAIGSRSVHLLVGVGRDELVLALQSFEQGIMGARVAGHQGKLVMGKISGFEGEGLCPAIADAFQLNRSEEHTS